MMYIYTHTVLYTYEGILSHTQKHGQMFCGMNVLN